MKAAIFLCVMLAVATQAQILVVQRQFNIEPVQQAPELPDGLGDIMDGAISDFKQLSEQMDRDMADMERQMNDHMSTAFLRGDRAAAQDDSFFSDDNTAVEVERPATIEVEVRSMPMPRSINWPGIVNSLFRITDMINRQRQQGSLAPESVPMETIFTEAAESEPELTEEAADAEPVLAEETQPIEESDSETTADEEDNSEEAPEEPAEEEEEEEEEEKKKVEPQPEKAAPVLAAAAAAPSTQPAAPSDVKSKITVFVLSAVGAFVMVIGIAIVVIKKQISSVHGTPFGQSFGKPDIIDRAPILPGGEDPEIASLMQNRPYSPPSL